MIPVQVNLRTSRGQERKYTFRMVDDELFTPVLAYVALASVLQSNERAFGTSTVRVDARLSLTGKPDVRVVDLFTQEQPAMQAAALVAAPLAYLMSNDFERVSRRRPPGGRLLRRDHPDRDPRARVAGAHRARASRAPRSRLKVAAAHVPRRSRLADHPGRHPRRRARRDLHAAGLGRRRP